MAPNLVRSLREYILRSRSSTTTTVTTRIPDFPYPLGYDILIAADRTTTVALDAARDAVEGSGVVARAVGIGAVLPPSPPPPPPPGVLMILEAIEEVRVAMDELHREVAELGRLVEQAGV